MPANMRPARSKSGCLVGLVVVLALVAIGLVAAVTFMLLSGPKGYVSPYNWDNLTWDAKGRPHYTEKGKPASLLGVDVSAYDKDVNWKAVAADGFDFTILRVGWRGYTEGGLYEDDYFVQNLRGAKEAGLLVGVYIFSSAITPDEAREEANFALSIVRREGVLLDLPIVFDHEPVKSSDGRANRLTQEQATAIASAFCTRVEAAGYQAMIYGNQKDMARFDKEMRSQRPLWLAEYGSRTPSAQFDFCFWQYTSTGSVAGHDRDFDLDIWFTTTLPLENYLPGTNKKK